MQEDVHRDCRSRHVSWVPRRPLQVQWIVLSSLLLTACGGSEDATSRPAASPTLMAVPPQVASGPDRMAAQDRSLKVGESSPPAISNDTAAASAQAASLAQLSALPHLSSLSAREKAGLFMLLPSKSSSERLALINMYPSLVQLPELQKQVLLDKLEKIVPVPVSERR